MSQDQMQICSNQKKQRITTAAFSAKFKSKKEIYRFLTVDVKAYLCNCDSLTIYFLKGTNHSFDVTMLTWSLLLPLDLAMAKKNFIKCDDIRTLACP